MLLDVNQVMTILNCKQAKAYNVIRSLNKELKEKGFYIIQGKIEEKYLKERFNIKN